MKQCLFCKNPIKDTPGRRPKKYCDDNCRQKHFQAQRRNNKAADPFSKKGKKSTKKIKGNLEKAENGKVKFVPKKTGKINLVEPPELDSKVDFKVGVDTFDTDKLDTLADEPKMWQEGDAPPPSGIIKRETKVAGMIFTDKEGKITKVITKPVFPLITDNEGKVVDVGEELMYPSDYNDLLRMAKSGVTNESAFRRHVEGAKLTPGQRGMIYSKLKK